MNPLPINDRRPLLTAGAVFLAAVAIRLAWVLLVDPASTYPQLAGGDGQVYLRRGWALAAGIDPVCYLALGGTATGPVYPLYLSLFFSHAARMSISVPCQADFDLLVQQAGVDGVIFAARVGQAVIDALMCCLIYDAALRLFDRRVGLLAG